tara:strand:+ start:2686 stop:3621 length:936 start_codon:yes stop_codon:yes gene_type:complete
MATEEQNIEAGEGEEVVEEAMTPEEQLEDQLDFDDPDDDIQQEALADYVEDKMSDDDDYDLEDDVDDSDQDIEDLLDVALDVGLTPEDIDELGSLEAVENYISIAQRQMNEVEADEEEERPDFSLDYELPENTPDNVKDAVQGLVSKLEEKLAGFERVFGEFEDIQESAQIEQTEAQFDQMIEDVGSNFSGLFGSGPTEELSDDSPFLENRVLLIEEMNALAAGYEAQGRDVPDEGVLMQKAIASAFTQDRDALAAQQMRSAIDSRRDAFTASPTQRRGRAMSPEAAAKQSVRSYMEQAGLLNGIDDPQDF